MKEYAQEKQTIQWSLYKVLMSPVKSGFLFVWFFLSFCFHSNKHLLSTYYLPISSLGFYEKSLSRISIFFVGYYSFVSSSKCQSSLEYDLSRFPFTSHPLQIYTFSINLFSELQTHVLEISECPTGMSKHVQNLPHLYQHKLETNWYTKDLKSHHDFSQLSQSAWLQIYVSATYFIVCNNF